MPTVNVKFPEYISISRWKICLPPTCEESNHLHEALEKAHFSSCSYEDCKENVFRVHLYQNDFIKCARNC